MAKLGQKTLTKKDYRLLIYLFPFMLIVVLFSYVPLIGWGLAFFDYFPGIPLNEMEFVGFGQFERVFKDISNIGRVMKNTVTFALLGYLVSPLPVVMAISLNEVKSPNLKRIIQTVTTFPNFISWVIIYAVAFQFFSNDGLVSTLFQKLGLVDKPFSLLANADSVYVFQTMLGVWKGVGWSCVLYLAAIVGIDQELFEAADIDGASRMQKIFHITVPSILPTFIVLSLLAISSFVGVGFDQYFLFNNGMVADKIEVIDLYVYRVGLMKSDYSFGTAVGIMKSVIAIAMLFGVNGLSKKIRGYSII
ncbi:sugar ABC transporter permease [Spirochaetia bacterium]|nr:sugar ABC transporter permease [Spirochaetia bacterium]